MDIALHLDRSQQATAEAAARADSKKTAQQLISDTDAAEKAKLEFIKRANAQKVAELANSQKTEVELAKEAARQAEKAAKEAAAAKTKADKEALAAKTKEERAAAAESAKIARAAQAEATKTAKEAEDARLRVAKESTDARIKFEQSFNAEVNRLLAESSVDEKKWDAERIASGNRVAREQLKAQQTKTRESQKLLKQETKEHGNLVAAQEGSIVSMIKMGAAMLGLQSASSVLHAIVDDLDKARAYAQKTAEDILKMRGAIRELAALRGELGKTGPTTAHVAAIAAQTLQTPQQAMETEQVFRGVAQLAIGKSLKDQAQADELGVSAGKFAAMEGGSPKAHAVMMGQIALQATGPISTPEAEARAYKIHSIIQPGAFESDTQAMHQLQQLGGYVKSGTMTGPQTAGLASIMSLDNPEEAATLVQAAVQASIPAQYKAKGIKLDPEMDEEKTFEFLKKLGVKDEKDPFVVLDKIAADFKSEQTKTPNLSIEKYLPEHGYGNVMQVRALRDYITNKNDGTTKDIEKAITAPLEYGGHGKGVITELHAERLKIDPAFQGMKIDRLKDLNNLKKGLSEEPLLNARRAAFESLRDEGNMYGEYEDWGNPSIAQQKFSDISHVRDTGANSYQALRQRTYKLLAQEADRLHIPYDKSMMFGDSDSQLATKVQEAGGSAVNQLGDRLEKSSKSFEGSMAKFEKVADNLLKATKPVVPPNIPGKPNGPVMRVP